MKNSRWLAGVLLCALSTSCATYRTSKQSGPAALSAEKTTRVGGKPPNGQLPPPHALGPDADPDNVERRFGTQAARAVKDAKKDANAGTVPARTDVEVVEK